MNHTISRHLIFALMLILSLTVQAQGPQKAELIKKDGGYVLLRAGKPYFIKGAGGTAYLDRLKNYGGNSIRTWSTSGGKQVLDEAQQLGLSVTMGLWVSPERHGFNYDDPVAVQKQLNQVRAEILKYKDHPALLAWGIGNELNLEYKNPKVWDAVNAIAEMIHELDSNHLVTTMLAGINQPEIEYIKERCPALDLISVQVYGGLASVPQQIRAAGWDKAYMVTEWGPTGHWESPLTPWKAAIEESSTAKAAVYKSRYEASILRDPNCLGSYVFLWGQKQERTPTWYGLFTEAGEETGVVDVMQQLWSGARPANRAPQLETVLLDGKKALDVIYLVPGKSYKVELRASDPDQDQLSTRLELLLESTDLKSGGDRESRPKAITGLLKDISSSMFSLLAPKQEGAYRLFLYVSDGKNKVATANIPFYVKK